MSRPGHKTKHLRNLINVAHCYSLTYSLVRFSIFHLLFGLFVFFTCLRMQGDFCFFFGTHQGPNLSSACYSRGYLVLQVPHTLDLRFKSYFFFIKHFSHFLSRFFKSVNIEIKASNVSAFDNNFELKCFSMRLKGVLFRILLFYLVKVQGSV